MAGSHRQPAGSITSACRGLEWALNLNDARTLFLDGFMAQWEKSNQRAARQFLGDPNGQLFLALCKTRNTTTEYHRSWPGSRRLPHAGRGSGAHARPVARTGRARGEGSPTGARPTGSTQVADAVDGDRRQRPHERPADVALGDERDVAAALVDDRVLHHHVPPALPEALDGELEVLVGQAVGDVPGHVRDLQMCSDAAPCTTSCSAGSRVVRREQRRALGRPHHIDRLGPVEDHVELGVGDGALAALPRPRPARRLPRPASSHRTGRRRRGTRCSVRRTPARVRCEPGRARTPAGSAAPSWSKCGLVEVRGGGLRRRALSPMTVWTPEPGVHAPRRPRGRPSAHGRPAYRGLVVGGHDQVVMSAPASGGLLPCLGVRVAEQHVDDMVGVRGLGALTQQSLTKPPRARWRAFSWSASTLAQSPPHRHRGPLEVRHRPGVVVAEHLSGALDETADEHRDPVHPYLEQLGSAHPVPGGRVEPRVGVRLAPDQRGARGTLQRTSSVALADVPGGEKPTRPTSGSACSGMGSAPRRRRCRCASAGPSGRPRRPAAAATDSFQIVAAVATGICASTGAAEDADTAPSLLPRAGVRLRSQFAEVVAIGGSRPRRGRKTPQEVAQREAEPAADGELALVAEKHQEEALGEVLPQRQAARRHGLAAAWRSMLTTASAWNEPISSTSIRWAALLVHLARSRQRGRPHGRPPGSGRTAWFALVGVDHDLMSCGSRLYPVRAWATCPLTRRPPPQRGSPCTPAPGGRRTRPLSLTGMHRGRSGRRCPDPRC